MKTRHCSLVAGAWSCCPSFRDPDISFCAVSERKKWGLLPRLPPTLAQGGRGKTPCAIAFNGASLDLRELAWIILELRAVCERKVGRSWRPTAVSRRPLKPLYGRTSTTEEPVIIRAERLRVK